MSDEREDRVRERAYALWRADGSPEGLADAYWYRAQAELDAQPAAHGAAGVPLEDNDLLPPGKQVPRGSLRPQGR
ncbi:DUF2934 domain-containing protein [Burkholderia glumae]|uniref:DUF2934 domain-containing protein n=1 Tax=Burkholderia glumae TaxID=337 RepID=UPI002037268F|nr:DUF2934 domain-containing protein [Burkholderia glumae]MCM2483692.1 DUF2934 domain-containing protein [Burkholderia glumae]MCM2509394.1 DUF2934 domain-containing protein [Burkholderia glumae]